MMIKTRVAHWGERSSWWDSDDQNFFHRWVPSSTGILWSDGKSWIWQGISVLIVLPESAPSSGRNSHLHNQPDRPEVLKAKLEHESSQSERASWLWSLLEVQEVQRISKLFLVYRRQSPFSHVNRFWEWGSFHLFELVQCESSCLKSHGKDR